MLIRNYVEVNSHQLAEAQRKLAEDHLKVFP